MKLPNMFVFSNREEWRINGTGAQKLVGWTLVKSMADLYVALYSNTGRCELGETNVRIWSKPSLCNKGGAGGFMVTM